MASESSGGEGGGKGSRVGGAVTGHVGPFYTPTSQVSDIRRTSVDN